MKAMILICVCLLLVGICFGDIESALGNALDNISSSPKIVPVTEINLDSFMGRWFQMYASLIPSQTYEKDLVCIGADYVKINSTAFSLNHFGRVSSPTGVQKSLGGTSTLPDIDQPGKWVVEIDSVDKKGDFWVLHLGEIIEDKYLWAIVSDSKGLNSFVLARDPDVFKKNYDSEVVQILSRDGFNGLYAPVSSYQSDTCIY